MRLSNSDISKKLSKFKSYLLLTNINPFFLISMFFYSLAKRIVYLMFFAEKFSQIKPRFSEKPTIKDPSTFEIEGIFCFCQKPNYFSKEVSVVSTDIYCISHKKNISKGFTH